MSWHDAGPAQALAADTVLSVEIGGHRIVLWRGAGGAAAALADRCAHMPAPLSTGRCVAGRLQCRHHGLEYDEGGRILGVFGHDLTDDRRVRSYRVEERGGRIRVWIDDAADAAGPPAAS